MTPEIFFKGYFYCLLQYNSRIRILYIFLPIYIFDKLRCVGTFFAKRIRLRRAVFFLWNGTFYFTGVDKVLKCWG